MRADTGRRKRARRYSAAYAAVMLVVLAYTVSVSAQEVKPLAITDIDGHIEVSMDGDIQKRDRPDSAWDSREDEFRESVGLGFEGYLYHPRFVTFNVGSLVEYVQDQFHGDGSEGGDTSGVQIEGDWSFELLREHPYSLSVRGRRGEQNIRQPFGRNYTSENESHGATLRIQKGALPFPRPFQLPFQFSLDRNTVKGSGTGSDINETTDEFHARTSYAIGERWAGYMQYRLTRTDEKAFDREFETQQFLLNDTVHLDAERKLRLNGSVQVHALSGFSDSTQISVRENLSWRHTDSLNSSHRVAYRRSDVGSQSTRIWNLGSSLTHKLYESLHTHGEFHGTHEDADFGKTATYGGSLSETYTKRLGRWGSIGLSGKSFIEEVDRQPQQETAWTFDEAHVVQAGLPFELRNTDVKTISISITDDRGVRFYRPFVDYVVNTRGIMTEIQPLLTGGIPENSIVLVDYEYDLGGRGKIRTIGHSVSSNLELGEWMSLYARNIASEQRLVTGTDDSRLDDLDRKTVGGSLAWRWLTTGAEYERRDSVFSGAETVREWVSATWSPAIGWWAQLGGSNVETRFTDTDQRLRNLSAFGTLRGRINRNSELEITGDYRGQRWNRANDSNNSDAYGLEMAYLWYYRKLVFEANGRASRIDQRQQDDQRYEFELSLRREF